MKLGWNQSEPRGSKASKWYKGSNSALEMRQKSLKQGSKASRRGAERKANWYLHHPRRLYIFSQVVSEPLTSAFQNPGKKSGTRWWKKDKQRTWLQRGRKIPCTMKFVVRNDLTMTNVAGMENNTKKDEQICGGLYAGDSGEELGQGEAWGESKKKRFRRHDVKEACLFFIGENKERPGPWKTVCK